MTTNEAKQRVLSFEDGRSQVLDIQELKQTQSIMDSQIPEHWEFFEEVMKLLKKHKVNAEFGNIYVNEQGQSKAKGASVIKRLEDKYGKQNIQSYLIRRALTIINLTDFSSEEKTYSIALNYLQDGVQAAIGNNVHICGNMCLYGGKLISTFGKKDNKFSYDQFIEHIEYWIEHVKELYDEDEKIINALKNAKFDNSTVPHFFGTLMFVAIGGVNFVPPETKVPFNETESKEFQRRYLAEIVGDFNESAMLIPTLWDFINIGTTITDFLGTDPFRVLTANRDINAYVIDYYLPEIHSEDAEVIKDK